MAGQVQLAASGPQEKYFTLNPDYSYFVESFKKHSNFSTQYVDIDPENQVNFGSKVQFKVPQNNGDLLKTISVKFTLPALSDNMIYIESVGHALIEYVDLIIGGKVIQRITSDYLQIYSEHYMTQTKQKALEQLIGKYPLRTSDRLVSQVVNNAGIIINGTLGLGTEENFFVDIPFYFHEHPELAVPLCAINKQEVEVEFKLRNAQDIVIKVNGNYETLDQGVTISDFQLCSELVYLDCAERVKIQNTSRDYLITQIQQNVFDVGVGVNEGSFKLDLVNPVKELYFVIQRQGTTGDGITQGNFVTPFDYDNLYAVTLTLDGQDIITQETGNVIFLKAIQAAIHHSKTQLIRRFYSYSFALQPEEWYPTGQVNFSLIKEQILNLNMTDSPDFARQIRVYAESYNILRVSEGIAQSLFNVKY